MDGFEEKLGAILGNEAAMGQIMALAQSLSGPGAPGKPEDGDGGQAYGAPPGDGPEDPVRGGGDLFSTLGDLDPRLLQMGARMAGELGSGENKSAALLCALRPFLKKERQTKLDRAIQVARLSRVARVLLQTMGQKGEEGDV